MLTDKDLDELHRLGTRARWRKRVDLMCKDCIYDPLDIGTWRAQVAACRAVSCPLHAVRPKTTKKKD